MKSISNFARILVGIAVVSAGIGTAALPANSQSQQPGTPANAIAQFLEVSPPKYDLSIPPGQTVERQVTITNKHFAPISLRVSFDNILPDGVTGGVKYTAEQTPYDLASWAKYNLTELRLNARESRQITVTLTAPAKAAPGGYYGMLRFTPTDRSDLPPVAVQGQIATLFLVRVPGPANEKGNIKEFYAERNDGQRVGWLVVSDELDLITLIHNGGNVHFSTGPEFTATDLFGKQKLSQKQEAQNIFPQSDRQFQTEWKNIATGYYTVKVKTNLPGQPNAERTLKFVVLTPTVAVVLLAATVLLALWTLNKLRKRRRAKKAARKSAKPKS